MRNTSSRVKRRVCCRQLICVHIKNVPLVRFLRASPQLSRRDRVRGARLTPGVSAKQIQPRYLSCHVVRFCFFP